MKRAVFDDAVVLLVAEEKRFSTLADPAEMDIYYLQNSVDTTRSYLKANRAQAIRFAKGLIEGIAYFKKYKKESLEVLQKSCAFSRPRKKTLNILKLSYNLLATKFTTPRSMLHPRR